MGSSCLRPLVRVMWPQGAPLIRIEYVTEVTQSIIMFTYLSEKPIFNIISFRHLHSTLSKALLISVWVVVNMSVFSIDGMADLVELKKGSIEVSITVLGASCVSGFWKFELGKEFNALSISVIWTINRFGLDRISMFVGIVSGFVAWITVAAGRMVVNGFGCGCVCVFFATGSDGRMEGDGVGWWGHGSTRVSSFWYGQLVVAVRQSRWPATMGCTIVHPCLEFHRY